MLGRRERKKQATRQALRRAALRLAAEHGVDHLTVEEISEAADVAPRTFFNYFTCKDEALVGGSEEFREELRAAVAARPAGEPATRTLRAVLKEVATAHTSDEHQEEVRLRQRLVTDNPSLLPRHLARFAGIEQAVAEAMAERTGTDPEHDLRPSLLAAVGAAVGRVAIRRWTADDSQPMDQLIDEVFDLLEQGL